jgi:hypothetical protein
LKPCEVTVISELRLAFNSAYEPEKYRQLLEHLDAVSGTKVEFRVAETPIFLPKDLLEAMAAAGIRLAQRLMEWPEYLTGARKSIPAGYLVAGQPSDPAQDHPHFLTADFALVANEQGGLEPRLVEIQAFPSVFAYQAALNEEYRAVFGLPQDLGTFLGGLDEESFWSLLRKAILGRHAPENVVLTEVDPLHQKTLPDFLITARKLGIVVVDIATLVPVGNKLHYRDASQNLIPIHRIYNRAIADEMIGRKIQLPFQLTQNWDVEWAGHPNWYFLISKYAVPWLSVAGETVVPPAAFLDDFLAGPGLDRLKAAGVPLPEPESGPEVYENLLLKPLFSFAGKGIQFAPTRSELEAIPSAERGNYLVQQKMHFVPTIATPHGLTQAEIRILYIWPDNGELTPALSLVRLGRGKMMGVDHNRNQEWVGASGAFWR